MNWAFEAVTMLAIIQVLIDPLICTLAQLLVINDSDSDDSGGADGDSPSPRRLERVAYNIVHTTYSR